MYLVYMQNTLFEEWFINNEILLGEGFSTSYKFNIGDATDEEIEEFILGIYNYHIDNSTGVYLATCGKHTGGVKELPHIHFHIISTTYKGTTNESLRRKKWFQKQTKNGFKLPPRLSSKQGKITCLEEIEKCLMYPYKEKKIYPLPLSSFTSLTQIPLKIHQHLEAKGEAAFAAKQDLDLAKQRKLQKAITLQGQLQQLLGTKKYDNYQQYKEFIYEAYYKSLSLDEYPDLNNLQKEIKNLALFRKIVPYHYFDKN